MTTKQTNVRWPVDLLEQVDALDFGPHLSRAQKLIYLIKLGLKAQNELHESKPLTHQNQGLDPQAPELERKDQ